MKPPGAGLARECAGLMALVVIVGVMGWTGTPQAAAGRMTPWGMGFLTIAALLSGVLAHGLMRRYVSHRLEPLKTQTIALRESALRPRDQMTFVRRSRRMLEGNVASEIREHLEAQEALLAKVELRHSQQTAWIGAVVHDVRTPLAAAANALGALVGSRALVDTEEATLILRVVSELRALERDVQRMLDMIRFEREDVEIERVEVDLAAVANGVAERLSRINSVPIEVRGDGGTVGDRTLLDRAIENLVANAARYARTRVVVQVFPGLLRVADDGPGLPAPLELLAKPFRSEPTHVAGVSIPGGAGGIGLFFSRRVFELHGGKLVLESTGDRGTVVLAYTGDQRGR